MSAQIIMFPGARTRPAASKNDEFPAGITAAKAIVAIQYRNLGSASADEIARRHELISSAWNSIPFGAEGRSDEHELYRKHEREFFYDCLEIGIPPSIVAQAMVIRGSNKGAINRTFQKIGQRAELEGWTGYAAFEQAIGVG